MSAVQLFVYDLSQGMARMMSMPLTGRQIDGIWHTSVVVFGREICFGQGIQIFQPEITPYGAPVEKISMGQTMIPPDVFWEYIETMKTIWTADKYHLLDNNCNSFSDEVCQFLVGSGIPKHITGLPAEFLNTALGQQLRPMIENMFGPSKLTPASSSVSIASSPKQVIECTNLTRLMEIIQSHRCVAIDFTSRTCGPCRIISPEFEKLIQELNVEKEEVVGVSVETDIAWDVKSHFEILATPTFMFFLDGKKFSEFRGANYAELKSSLEFLVYTANPPHPNSRLNLETLVVLTKGDCIHFSLSSDMEKILGKLEEFVTKNGLHLDVNGLRNYMAEHNVKETTGLPRQWGQMCQVLDKLPAKELFPLLDVFRLLVQNPIASRYFVYEDSNMLYLKTINRVLDSKEAGMATKLMLLKFVISFNIDMQLVFARGRTLQFSFGFLSSSSWSMSKRHSYQTDCRYTSCTRISAATSIRIIGLQCVLDMYANSEFHQKAIH
jgi:thiol-disulfide isomerase/thioredoxin